LPLCFFFRQFFQRLISEVTEQIPTKRGHIFTYDCYLNNLVRTPPGIYLPRAGGKKKRFWWLTLNFDRTYYFYNNRKETCQSTGTPLYAPNLVNVGLDTAENGWRVFAHPLNFRIGRHCEPYHMDVKRHELTV